MSLKDLVIKMQIVTFNLRCVWDEPDGINGFINRAGQIITKIKKEKPDVICFQEATPQTYRFLEEVLPDYVFLFNQRQSNFAGEGVMTAVNRKTVGVLGLEFFWLSDTPYVAGSRFAIQSEFPRICQSLILKNNRSGKLFRVYNTHLDHISDEARICGIKLIISKIKEDCEKFDMPYFLLGDFNALPNSETIKYCKENSFLKMVDLTENSGGTFHNFGRL